VSGWEQAVEAGDRVGEVRALFADIDLADPRQAFALGLAYGRAMERERIDAEDLQIAGMAAGDIVDVVERVDRWTRARS
jgi:hypothetical protein